MFNVISSSSTKPPSLERAFAVLEATERIKPNVESIKEIIRLLTSSREPEDQERILTALYALLTSAPLTNHGTLRPILIKVLQQSPPDYIKKIALDCLLAVRLNSFCQIRSDIIGQLEAHRQPSDELILLLTILGNLGIRDCLPMLSQYCQHHNYRVRRTACEILGKAGHKEGLITLVESLYDDDKEVRESALWGLDVFWVSMGKQAVPALIEMLNQTNSPKVKSYILETLKRSLDKRAEAVLAQVA